MGTTIEWTDRTWNPLRGCTRISPGCQNCYAERMAARDFPGHKSPTTGDPFAIMAPSGPRWTGNVELIESKLTEPLHWRKPQRVFVNSMSDLFHESVPDEWIDRVFAVMALTPHITYQVLTKRSERMRKYFAARRVSQIYGWDRSDGSHKVVLSFGPSLHRYTTVNVKTHGDGSTFPLSNVWLGVSIEDQQRADERIPHLQNTPAAVRFVSYEPALGPVDWMYPKSLWPDGPPMCCNGLECGCHGLPVDPPLIHGIDWLIIGGESGPGARPFNLDWARQTIKQCREWGVAPFFKQAGRNVWDVSGRVRLRDIKGKDPEEWPADLRVREFPQ